MDRSLLSDENVIAAAKDFVCIRLATYEDSQEAKYLRKVFQGRNSRDLENTVFVMLEPDGKTKLCRAARSPHMVFGHASRLAQEMQKISALFPAKKKAKHVPRVPKMKNFRLALNVAACDGLPLLVAYGEDGTLHQKAESVLSKLAFNPELAGKLHFYGTSNVGELKSIKGFDGKNGFYLLGPNTFGDKAQLAEFVSLNNENGKAIKDAALATKELRGLLGSYIMFMSKDEKSHHQHVQSGLEAGVDWKTEVPVTDKMSLRAKQQADRRRARKRK